MFTHERNTAVPTERHLWGEFHFALINIPVLRKVLDTEVNVPL
jgi:hypothetical protein